MSKSFVARGSPHWTSELPLSVPDPEIKVVNEVGCEADTYNQDTARETDIKMDERDCSADTPSVDLSKKSDRKKKKLLSKKERDTIGCSERESRAGLSGVNRDRVSSPSSVDDCRTSTPVRIKRVRMNARVKAARSKRGVFVKRRNLQLAEEILREAAQVDLSTSSASATGRDGSAGNIPEFESMSSGVTNEVQRILSDLVREPDDMMNSSQDPVTEEVIMSFLAGSGPFNNPFQVTENIRLEMIRQAKAAGTRAMAWSMNSFDQIGGHNTLRRVWAKLKGDGMVEGRKMLPSDAFSSNDNLRAAERSPKR